MSVDQTSLAGWRSAETYRPLLGADAGVWAWEFGRRGLAREVSVEGELDGGAVPELCFASSGPPGDPTPIVLWHWRADSTVPVLSLSPAPVGDPDALDLKSLAVMTLVVRTEDGGQHVVVGDGARRLRFAVVDGDVLAGPAICRFRLPPQAIGGGSLLGLRRLIALRDTGRLPSAGYRPHPKAARWLQILRAHDARAQGASQRDIAVMLFGEPRVREDWSGRSDYMRMRVQRLLRAAEDLVAGGYRALFGLRPVVTRKPKVVEVWRSAGWR
jgi:hypothetical protein